MKTAQKSGGGGKSIRPAHKCQLSNCMLKSVRKLTFRNILNYTLYHKIAAGKSDYLILCHKENLHTTVFKFLPQYKIASPSELFHT